LKTADDVRTKTDASTVQIMVVQMTKGARQRIQKSTHSTDLPSAASVTTTAPSCADQKSEQPTAETPTAQATKKFMSIV
jgi:hypothetical protein